MQIIAFTILQRKGNDNFCLSAGFWVNIADSYKCQRIEGSNDYKKGKKFKYDILLFLIDGNRHTSNTSG